MCETRCCRAYCGLCASCQLHEADADVVAQRRGVRARFRAYTEGLLSSPVWVPLPLTAIRDTVAAVHAEGGGPPAPWTRQLGDTATLLFEVSAVRLTAAWFTRFQGWNLAFLAGVLGGTALVTRTFFSDDVRCPQLDAQGDMYFDFCPLPE